MVEEIYVKHPAVNDGAETRLVDVEMTDIHELSPTSLWQKSINRSRPEVDGVA